MLKEPLRIDILTIQPEYFQSPLSCGLLHKAIEKGIISIGIHNIRDYSKDKYRKVDDRPYGGGAGMVMKPEPVVLAIEAVTGLNPQCTKILLTPQGRLFNQQVAKELSRHRWMMLLCARYEGIDERVRKFYIDDELSIGDYIISGGEAAALVVIEAVCRNIEGFMGNVNSISEESFEEGLLEYPQYTRPEVFRDHRVPSILLSGDHEKIRKWRRKQSLLRTMKRRPDLFERLKLTPEDMKLLSEEQS